MQTLILISKAQRQESHTSMCAFIREIERERERLKQRTRERQQIRVKGKLPFSAAAMLINHYRSHFRAEIRREVQVSSGK